MALAKNKIDALQRIKAAVDAARLVDPASLHLKLVDDEVTGLATAFAADLPDDVHAAMSADFTPTDVQGFHVMQQADRAAQDDERAAARAEAAEEAKARDAAMAEAVGSMAERLKARQAQG